MRGGRREGREGREDGRWGDHRRDHRARWHRMMYAARRDPRAHAAMHAWLHEFEARMAYGMDKRWAWQRGRHSLSRELTLVFILLALATGLLARFASDWPWLLAGGVVASLAAYALVRHMLRPLWMLGLGVAAFGRGDLEHRIPVRRRDEIGALAARFNQMADDIVGMLDAKRGLLLAISHELRSPITRARLNVELLPEGPEQQALIQDLALMRDLIEALIERERLDAGHSALLLQDVDWPQWIEALVGRRFSAARASGDLVVSIEADLPPQRADRMRMELLICNLLDNALRHNERANGAVRLSLTRAGQGVCIAVRDFGSGVPEESLAQMGEPFFRPDESRSRASGGVGLGLSLCKLIASAHGSELSIRNAAPGLEISLILQAP